MRCVERDACGIGFVADAQGRPSRAVVEAALKGLACVTHRGALAADAKTADGSGLLVPVPPAIFGEGHGVAVLFVRGDDPRPAVEAEEGRSGAVRCNPARAEDRDDRPLVERRGVARQAVDAPLDPLEASGAHPAMQDVPVDASLLGAEHSVLAPGEAVERRVRGHLVVVLATK